MVQSSKSVFYSRWVAIFWVFGICAVIYLTMGKRDVPDPEDEPFILGKELAETADSIGIPWRKEPEKPRNPWARDPE